MEEEKRGSDCERRFKLRWDFKRAGKRGRKERRWCNAIAWVMDGRSNTTP